MAIPRHEERLEVLESILQQLAGMGANISNRGVSRLRQTLRAIDEGLRSNLDESGLEQLYIEVIERLILLAAPVSRRRVDMAIEGLNDCLAEGQPHVDAIAIDHTTPRNSLAWMQWPFADVATNNGDVGNDLTDRDGTATVDLARRVPSHRQFRLTAEELQAVEFFQNQLRRSA